MGPRIGRFVNGVPVLISGHTVPVRQLFLLFRILTLEFFNCIFEVVRNEVFLLVMKAILVKSTHKLKINQYKVILQIHRTEKRWQLYILPQYLANLTEPLAHIGSHILAKFIPVLTILCVCKA